MSDGAPAAAGKLAQDLDWHAPHNPWLIAIVATLATFMEVLDSTIVNVSLPHIAGNLGADVQDSTWVLTSYLVSNAIILPVSAWLSSVMGRKNYYLVCIAGFTVSSLLCGLAPTLGSLVGFRLLQGFAGGGLQPITQAILVDTFPPRQRGMSMAIFGMTVIFAPIIGPTFGGWITDNFSWRWVFFINVPIGILATLLISRLISDPPYLIRRLGADRFRMDFIGLGLISIAICSFQMVMDLGERYDWFASTLITGCAVVAGVTFVIGVIWEFLSDDPVVDLHLLRDRNFAFAVALMFVFGCGLYASTALLPLYMQTLLGYPATTSGMAISPGGIVVLCMMPFIGWVVSRFDARKMIAFGMIIIAYSLYQMSFFTPYIDFRTVVTSRVVQSFGMSFVFVPMNTIAYAFIPREKRNSASSLINLSRNLGGSLGIAFTSTMITQRSQAHQVFLTENISRFNPAASQMFHGLVSQFTMRFGDPIRAAATAKLVLSGMVSQQARALAFSDAFRVVAPFVLLVVPLVLFMKRPPDHHAPAPGEPEDEPMPIEF